MKRMAYAIGAIAIFLVIAIWVVGVWGQSIREHLSAKRQAKRAERYRIEVTQRAEEIVRQEAEREWRRQQREERRAA